MKRYHLFSAPSLIIFYSTAIFGAVILLHIRKGFGESLNTEFVQTKLTFDEETLELKIACGEIASLC